MSETCVVSTRHSLARALLSNTHRSVELLRCIRLTPDWFKWIGSYVFGREIEFPTVFRTRLGDSVELFDWSELTTAWRVFLANEYLIDHSVETLLDVGANIGAFSVFAARQLPKAQIVAVEPFPDTYARLAQTIERNGLNSRVRCVQAAVTNRTGEVLFDAAVDSHSYARRIVDASSDRAIRVPALILGDLLERAGWSEVDYLKMDIEGGEYLALGDIPASMLRRAKAIGLEYHDSSKFTALSQTLTLAGFDRIRLRTEGWSGLAEFRRT